MEDKDIIASLLSGEGSTENAWKQFLTRYSKLILKILWQFEHQHDRVMDAYLAVCARLADRDFAVLRKFPLERQLRSSDFPLWLGAVVRNICLDRYRSMNGRRRLPRALQRMSRSERDVFVLHYWRGYSPEEIRHHLGHRLNGRQNDVPGIIRKINENLKRQPARDDAAHPVIVPFDETRYQSPGVDPGLPDMSRVEEWLGVLSPDQRLILRLRFWEDMPAADIARVLKISPSHRIYTILQGALQAVRKKAMRDRQTSDLTRQ